MPWPNRLVIAFTLVEMLVVIAILAILAILITPAAKGVIDRSNAAKCASNLRQIGVAYRAAVIDNNRVIPVFTVDANGNNLGSWEQVLHNASGWAGNFATNRIFLCPMDPRVPGNAAYDGFYRSYGENSALCFNSATGTPLVSIPEQTKTFLIMDVVKGFGAHPTFGGNYVPLARHGTNCNVLFVDGHVEALAPATITNAPYNWPGTPPETTTNAYRWK